MESLNSRPGTPNSSFYTPLLISMIGVFSTCVVLVIYHFILIRYCHRRTPQTASNGNAVAQAVPESPSLPSGVDHKLLETMPIIAYSPTKQQGGLFRVDQSECVVCLGALEQGEMVRLLPNCRHAFHVPCIDEWFVAHTSCPVCRSPIVAPAATVNDDIPPSSPPPPLQVFTSSSSFDVGSSGVEFPGQDYGNDASSPSSSSSSSGSFSFGLLRHSGSLELLPTERASSSARVITGLKRSLSMDQSSVIIEMQGESSTDDDDAATTTVGAFRSVRHFDRVSAKFLSSFSRLRLGNNNEILPY
nr:RING-H2 finger protein ATL52-like [Coffea arabica]